jgi:hypothetical protein
MTTLAAAAILAALLVPAAVADEARDGLRFVGPSALALTVMTGTSSTNKFSVWLSNDSASTVTPMFTTKLINEAGTEVKAEVEPLKVAAMPAYTVHRITLTIDSIAKLATSSGQLVASSETAPPTTLSLSIAPQSVYKATSAFVLIASGIFALLILGIASVGLRFMGQLRFGATLRPEDLEFSSGFAAGLTLVGALLGTIVSAGVIPEHTEWLSKDSYVALNLIFTGVIAVAALVYTAFQTEEGGKVHGRVWAFMVAAALTTWAAFGELLTIWLLISDIDATTGLTHLGTDIIHTVLAASGILMVVYLINSIYRITDQKPAVAAKTPLTRKRRVRSRASVKTGLL